MSLESAFARERIAQLERELAQVRASVRQMAADSLPESLDALVVAAGPAQVAIPLASVVEVIPRVMLIRLPGSPAWQAGFMRWRGAHVSVLDLGGRWSGEPLELRLEDRIVVLRHGDELRGLLVAEVLGVVRIERGTVSAVDADSPAAGFALGLTSHAGGSLLIASLDALLFPPALPEPE